jgi:hypothetical protein
MEQRQELAGRDWNVRALVVVPSAAQNAEMELLQVMAARVVICVKGYTWEVLRQFFEEEQRNACILICVCLCMCRINAVEYQMVVSNTEYNMCYISSNQWQNQWHTFLACDKKIFLKKRTLKNIDV